MQCRPISKGREHVYRADVAGLPEGTERPLWSVMIPTYHCAGFLGEALTSILVQDPGPNLMQIEVVDDHSVQDDPARVVDELAKGRVAFYRQPENVGYVDNFASCLQRSRGRLVHLLHGDDYVRPGFYRQVERAFAENPAVGAVYCRHIIMDEQGHWQRISPLEQARSGILQDALERIITRHPIQTPAIVVRREVYEKLGGFDRRFFSCGEDWEMWVRIAAHYPIWYEVQPLAVYRSHAGSLSAKAMLSGQNMRDLRLATEIASHHVEGAARGELSRKAAQLWAFCGLHCAVRQLFIRHDPAAAIAQIKEAMKCNPSLGVVASIAIQILRDAKESYICRRLGVEVPFS